MCYRAIVKHVVQLTCKIREYSCRYRVCTGSSHTRRCRPRNSVPWSQVHTCTCSCPRASDTRPRFDRATRHSNPVARNGHLKNKKETMLFNVLRADAYSRYIRPKNHTVATSYWELESRFNLKLWAPRVAFPFFNVFFKSFLSAQTNFTLARFETLHFYDIEILI